jgi:hypothetical protein
VLSSAGFNESVIVAKMSDKHGACLSTELWISLWITQSGVAGISAGALSG